MTEAPPRSLGMRWVDDSGHTEQSTVPSVNTRNALWSERWPAIALQQCVDAVEAAAPEDQQQVKYSLPCHVCPESTRCLNAKSKEVGSLLYGREYQTSPRTSASTLFPRELFVPMLRPQQQHVRNYRVPAGLENRTALVQAWDLAWSEKIGGDYLVCMTATVDLVTGQRRLLSIRRWQRLSFTEQCQLIEDQWRAFRADIVVIESDAAQQVWHQHLARTTAVPVVQHDAGGKRDLQFGVPGLLIQFENKKWEIPYARDGMGWDETENMLTEFEAFGFNDGKLEGVGEHDDTVMCFWHLSWGCGRVLYGGVREERHGNQPGRTG